MESLEDFYSQILDLDFLIEYGYYDRIATNEITQDVNDENNRLEENIVEQFYSESDNFFPDYFSTKSIVTFLQDENLGASIDDNFRIRYDEGNILGGTEHTHTDPIIFTIPKSNELSIRRTYKILNIYSYIRLAHYISLNQNYFTDLFMNNRQSTSKYFNHFERGHFKTTDKLSVNLLSYGNNILNLDLSNFYPSLYSHSLAWVDLGKQKAKRNRRDGIGNNLDNFVRATQYGESHGVPTGNFLTRIIAEYFLCKIDKEFQELGYIYTRYVDDLRFAYNDEKTKNDFLSHVHTKSNEYNFTLNEKKTFIERHPVKNELDKSRIFSFFDNFDSNNVLKWIDKLYDYTNICIAEEANGNKGALKILFRGMLFHIKDNPSINNIFVHTNPLNDYNLFKHHLDISLKDSKLANRFLNFTKQLISYGVDRSQLNQLVSEFFQENKEKIKSKINICLDNNYNQEVYQLLLYYLYFKVYTDVDDDQLNELIGGQNPHDEAGFLIKLINFDNDDFSIVLAMTIYMEIIINEFFVRDYDTYETYMDKLFRKLDAILKESYRSYLSSTEIQQNRFNNTNCSRMTEKLWFLRYHLYYLTGKYNSFRESLNNYYDRHTIPRNRRGIYKSQLNWEYIKTNKSIDKFYNLMLGDKVSLFDYELENYS